MAHCNSGFCTLYYPLHIQAKQHGLGPLFNPLVQITLSSPYGLCNSFFNTGTHTYLGLLLASALLAHPVQSGLVRHTHTNLAFLHITARFQPQPTILFPPRDTIHSRRTLSLALGYHAFWGLNFPNAFFSTTTESLNYTPRPPRIFFSTAKNPSLSTRNGLTHLSDICAHSFFSAC